MDQITVDQLMTENLECLPCKTPVGAVAKMMASNCHSCMVIGEDRHPAGIITERDLVKLLLVSSASKDTLDDPVEAFMSSPVHSLHHDESLYDAMVVAQTERIRHLPVIDNDDKLVGLVTQTDLANAHFHVIEMQADLIEKSIANKTADLKKANEELQALSMMDHLTEIGNRRAMEVDLQHTHAAALRYDRGYAVVLLDIDYFKKYNDHYGHGEGDQTLRRVAIFFRQSIRASDRLYRYGGEELLLLMPETSAKHALATARRLTKELARDNIVHTQSPFGVVTVSAGVAGTDDFECANSCWEAVVERADRGLYNAKDAGRNQAQAGG